MKENLDYLKDNVKYQGFGESLHKEIERQVKTGVPEFSLAFETEANKKTIQASLHFKKSEGSDNYFFNKYDVRVPKEKTDETVSQTFYMNKGHGVTLKEAYNLLNGRAVYKELTDKQDQKYHAWTQLNFNAKDTNGNYERKQYHENYGYDLKEAVSYYPIKEMMNADESKKLIRSLEKGNVQMATIEKEGKDERFFLEANPQFKSVTIYNDKMERLTKDQRQELMRKPEVRQENNLSQDIKPENKKTIKQRSDEDPSAVKKKTTRNKGMSI